MKNNSATRLFFLFLLIWFGLNVLQSVFTELDPDEAYYWVYSHQLDWGYFDHPPAIAVSIWVGRHILPGALGVRFFPILFSSGVIFLLWKILKLEQDKKGTWLLMVLVAGMPFMHLFSFIATPDAPLLFFGAFYLWLHQRFLQRADWLTTMLLGVTMAALLYSKYHGILWILLILASHWKVLLKPQYYVAGILGVILFLPHLYWQYANEFPSFRYHLSGRNDAYEFRYTTTYLLNQIIVFSPLLIGFIGYALWKFQAKNPFQRSWKFLIIGFWIIFLGLTAKGHAEPQWTAMITLPVILLLNQSTTEGFISRKWITRMAAASLALIMVARILVILPQTKVDSDFHKKYRSYIVQDLAQGAPVLFMDTYRAPSKYAFYTGEPPYALTDVYYRKNQYDLWDWAKALHNQRIMVSAQKNIECDFCKPLIMRNEVKGTYMFVDSFQVTQNMWIDFEIDADTLQIGGSYPVQLTIKNPYQHTVKANTGDLPIQLMAILTDKKDKKHWFSLAVVWDQIPGTQTTQLQGTLNIPYYGGEWGSAHLQVGFKAGVLFPTFNSSSKSVFLRQ